MGGRKNAFAKISGKGETANFTQLAKIRFFMCIRFSTFVYGKTRSGADPDGRLTEPKSLKPLSPLFCNG
jgi:hypothetical protein